MKKHIKNPDDHLVIHDVVSMAAATTLGVTGALVASDPGVGLLAAGVMVTAGIGGMRIGPVRRGVNAVAVKIQNKGKD